MAFVFTAHYEPDVEERMRSFYQTLSEKDRRRYAALEAWRLGRGGIEYVAEVLGCSRRTIERTTSELGELPSDPAGERTEVGRKWGQASSEVGTGIFLGHGSGDRKWEEVGTGIFLED